jgi:nitroreductase
VSHAHHHHAAAAPPAVPPEAIEAPTSAEALRLLAARRSLPLRSLVGPGPDGEELRELLTLAARVPDHGRLVPWRFILFEGEARSAAGERLDAVYARQNPDLPAGKKGMWAGYMARAPLLVVVVSRPDRQSKVPEWNQVLSAGAVCMNLIAAATAMGFAAHWLLKWPARDPEALAVLSVGEGERVAGFMHIGRPAERPHDRPRPDLGRIVTAWAPAG